MSDDRRDLELGATAPGPVALSDKTQLTVRPVTSSATASIDVTLAAGSAAPASGIAATASRAGARATATAHTAVLVLSVLAAIHTCYFVLAFLISGSPPVLHPAFLGKAPDAHGAFGATTFLSGPQLTLARDLLIAATLLPVAVWVARLNRRDTTVQAVAAVAVIASQFSISIAVLTSSEDAVAWRLLAATWHMLLPTGTLLLLAVFPNGVPVPRWSTKLIVPAVVPFAVQTANMYAYRAYSVPVTAVGFVFGCAFLGFQRHRYRHHASQREQHQIKWLTYAGGAFLAIQVVAVLAILPLLRDPQRSGFQLLKLVYEFLILSSYVVGLSCMLTSSARYRLWAIDRVINRTLVYVLVTLVLAGAFAVVFFALDASLRGVLALPAPVAFVMPLVVAGVAFMPARRRIARWIDRRVYGIGLDYEALAAKATRAVSLPTESPDFARYDELVLLGRGGMGAVYRAHHPDFGVPVALKVMSPELAADQGAQERFRREAQILEQLRHPNVIPFLASGHERGLAFIAMQYLDGEDLAATLRSRRRLSLDEVVPVVAGIAAALDAAHARGIVHRDIKPANVMLEGSSRDPIATRRPHVMDFGVAHRMDDATDDATDDDGLVGSLPYLSPEQIQHPNRVDGRADIYSLGATVYQLLTGRTPFVESTPLGFVMAHLRQPPDDPRTFEPSIPAEAATAVMTSLAKRPDDRFASAGAFAAALAEALSKNTASGRDPVAV